MADSTSSQRHPVRLDQHAGTTPHKRWATHGRRLRGDADCEERPGQWCVVVVHVHLHVVAGWLVKHMISSSSVAVSLFVNAGNEVEQSWATVCPRWMEHSLTASV